jgi:hypothetical protein
VFEVSKEGVRFGVALPLSSIPMAELLDMAMVNEEAGSTLYGLVMAWCISRQLRFLRRGPF